MERKMMLMLPKRVVASFMREKGLWRILFAQSTEAMFPDNGANFLSSWYQTEVNCCSISFYKRKILEEMREEAKKERKEVYRYRLERRCISLWAVKYAFHSQRQEETMAHYPKSSGHL